MKGVCFVLNLIYSQDIHFSQINETPILFNPAVTGNFEGYEQLTVNQRSQWVGGNTKYNTFSFAFEANLFKKKAKIERSYLGLGLQFYNDAGGDSKLGTRTGALSLSGVLPLQVGHKLAVGIQFGFGNKFVDITKVYFENQWEDDHYSSFLPSDEQNSLKGFNYLDASAGLFYTFTSRNKSFIHKRGVNFQIGFSVSHINQPHYKYLGIEGKFALSNTFSRNFKNKRYGFDLSSLIFLQGPHHQELIGGLFRYNFNASKITYGKSAQSYIGIGVFYRLRDALIPRIIIVKNGFKFCASYDLTTSIYKKAGSIGTFIRYIPIYLNNFIRN